MCPDVESSGPRPTRMGAAYVAGPGSADDIRYGELPVPAPGPTDVLVKVAAVAVDPVDTLIRSGAFPTAMPTPFIVGRDLVGEVVAAGSSAPGFTAGQRVWCNSLGYQGRQGSFADYAVVPADRLYPVPDGVDPIDLVAAAHPAATAWLALFRHGRLHWADNVYVGGGAGNVGSAAVALAAAAGARVVATASSDDADRVRELGAREVFDYHADDVLEQLQRAAGAGFQVHLDSSGHNDVAAAVGLLASRGRLVTMARHPKPPVVPLDRLYQRDGRIVGFAISNADLADLADAAAGVAELLRTTAWRPRIADRLPLSQAAEAHRRLENGEVSGRLVLSP